MLGHERPVLLRDARHVGAGVVNPDFFRGVALGEEDHVGLHALAVGSERAAGQTQDRVQVAVFGQNLKDLAGLVGEEAVVGQHHGGPPAGLQDRQDVLDEVELFVAGGDGEVVAVGGLVRPLGAEGRVGQDHVEAVGRRGLVDRVAQHDFGLQAVQEEVHQGQPAGPGHEVLAVVGLLADALGEVAVQRAALGLRGSAIHRPPPGNRPCRRPGRRW